MPSTGTPSSTHLPHIRTRAQAAAAAALSSAQPPPPKKRKREAQDDAGPSTVAKKVLTGNGLVKHWPTDSVAATEDVRVCRNR